QKREQSGNIALYRTGETGPEYRIYDYRTMYIFPTQYVSELCRYSHLLYYLILYGTIRTERSFLRRHYYRNLKPPVKKVPCHDQSITAVVAASAEHEYA